MNKGNQNIRGLRRTVMALLAMALLLTVSLPALGISAEGTDASWTVEQGGKASYGLPEGIQVDMVEITPEDGGLKATVEGSEVLLDAEAAHAGTYRVRLFYTDGSVIDQPVTVSVSAVTLQLAGGDAEPSVLPTEEILPEVTEAAAPESTAETEPDTAGSVPPETAEETESERTEVPPETTAETEPETTEETLSETETPDIQAELERFLQENPLLDLDPLAEGEPDLILEQGESGNYQCGGNRAIYVFPRGLGDGMTAQATDSVIRVTTAEDTPAGDYRVYYYQEEMKSFLVRVIPRETGGGTGTGPITETKTLSYEKTVMDKGDGTFALELTVSGAVGSQTNKAQVDVVFIVDNSNSMYPTYMPNTKTAMKVLVDNLNGNENIDARYSMVLYGTGAGIESGYTNASSIETAIDGIQQQRIGGKSDTGGTNYAAGIYFGKQLINNKRPDAMTVVIFLTDGKPTYRGGYEGAGNLAGNGRNDDERRNIGAAINEIKGMNCNYFYGIGLGSDYEDNLERLVNNVNATVTGVYNAGNTTEITNAFNEIAASVTTFLCENVTITDYLSKSDTGESMIRVTDPASVAVTVTKTDGTIVAGPAASVTLRATDRNAAATLSTAYDASTGVLVLHFPDTYQLEPDYIYKLSATIEPTEAAYEQYRTDGGYTHTGAPGTGTYAGQPGIPTNDSANVTYTYHSADGSAQYPLPVIPLNPGMLTITKTFAGLTEDQIAEAANTLRFQITLNQSIPPTVLSLEDMTPVDGVYTYTFDVQSPNTIYTVSETGGAVEGFQASVLVNGAAGTTAQGSVPAGGIQTVSYENAYTPANASVTVSKAVEGNLGDVEKQFRFTMELDRPISPKPTAGGDYSVSEDGKTVTFALRGGQAVTIANVPIGAAMTLTESGVSEYGVWMNGEQVKAEAETTGTAGKTFIIEEGLKIQVINRHDADIDTGITADATPYMMFLGLTALGGVLLVRNRRYIGE